MPGCASNYARWQQSRRVSREGITLKHARERFQNGSLRKVMRKSGTEIWEYRYRDKSQPGSPMRQMTLSATKYPTETKARVALQEQLLRINGAEAYVSRKEPTFGLVIDRYIKEERITEIMKQPPGEITITDGLAYSTAMVYNSLLKKHIRPKWEKTLLSQLRPLEVQDWLKSLPLAPKSQNHIKRLMHMLIDKAMLWGLIKVDRNPIALVKVRGGSKRRKEPTILNPEQFQALLRELKDPYRVMVIVAMCSGLRICEVLALCWEHLDFDAGAISVQQGSVAGRIGKTKTEASKDQVPMDSGLAEVLLDWGPKEEHSRTGLVFPSPVTGGCYHAGMIVKRHLKPAGEKIGLKQAGGWHSFRHSYRGMLDDTGANTGTQQSLLRHASVVTTMNVYGKSSMSAKRQANSKVVQMVLPHKKLCA